MNDEKLKRELITPVSHQCAHRELPSRLARALRHVR